VCRPHQRFTKIACDLLSKSFRFIWSNETKNRDVLLFRLLERVRHPPRQLIERRLLRGRR
jgi:hypothetical protein